jgi:6-phosphogluconolactonase (cycloisomerase 2 family)
VASENSIYAYNQMENGSLTFQAAVKTGGKGNGGSLGQGALCLGEQGSLLYAVNAGDNSISVFLADEFLTGSKSLDLIDVVPSGGTEPISITEHNDVVYVLNAGGAGNVTGFRWSWAGGLTPIANSTRELSTPAPTPEQVGFSRAGDSLVVSEKGTNMIDVFPVDAYGHAGQITSYTSQGAGPFGFGFGLNGVLVVSEAAGLSASSYELMPQSPLAVLTRSIPTHQMAPCWAVVTNDGDFAYVADAGSASITGYNIDSSGNLNPLNAFTGQAAVTDAHPIDMAVSYRDRYLYVVSNTGGAIDEFTIEEDGGLVPIAKIKGLPKSISGAVAR